ncbi:hypothetical protein [Lentimicrobium sp.]|uniref:hypothetical protein n=1 Tax=Lentimicrobium sp. TaxID=2034841 RepID=UPI002B880277|nr:hypothetical protein [Lentimicrobium sp.]HPR25725.1 hypothetical protein [Lentimicrobium sp.]
MKKDNLERFVREHAGEFDSLEAPPASWEVIEERVFPIRSGRMKKLRVIAWRSAAAVLIFAAAWMLNDVRDNRMQIKDADRQAVNRMNYVIDELSDAEAYYTSKIQSREQELAIYAKDHPEIIEDLREEFRAMDQRKVELRTDLAESNADAKVIEAIILSYRVKLEILDEMLLELRQTDKESNNDTKSGKEL